MVEIHWRRKQQRDGKRTQERYKHRGSHDQKSFYLLAVPPALRLKRHHPDRGRKREKGVQRFFSAKFHHESFTQS